jgi:hypothetical protein
MYASPLYVDSVAITGGPGTFAPVRYSIYVTAH